MMMACLCILILAFLTGYGHGNVVVMDQNINSYSDQFPWMTSEPEQKWGYVNVRSNAHMFWWLYYTTAPGGYSNNPWIIWLQGGPGGSSTGFGNFQEIGPLDVNLNARSTTWLNAASLLFIDNPVGTGYSYVTSDDSYSTNNTMIANDLVTVVSAFLNSQPEFQDRPLYIFSESYGGKMTADFGVALHKAIQSGHIKCNLKGVALGDSWISPLDYVLTWGPYLYATSLVDLEGLSAINQSAMECKGAYDAGDYAKSTALWSQTESVIEKYAAGVNFYNILKWSQDEVTKHDKHDKKHSHLEKLHNKHVKPLHGDPLDALMNGQIKKKLGIPDNVTWGGQSEEVFTKLSTDFMKPVIDSVDYLLTSTDLNVYVYNGQLDLICDTMGTSKWVQRLKWPGLPAYNNATRQPLYESSSIQQPWGFKKHYKNLYFYWILEAGHMVPSDVGTAALAMVNDIITGSTW